MGTRITQRDIAREAGVSHATVSMALSGHPGIPPETAARIKEIAKRLGYAPDPMLAALSVYRKSQQPSVYRANLAWVNCHQNPEVVHWGDFGRYYEGAVEKAAAAGYKLEEFCLIDFDNDAKRLGKALLMRGIQGLLVAPVELHLQELKLDWENFSAVRFGYSLQWPVLHTVTNSQFRSARTAVENLVRLGYRRIGLMISAEFDRRTGGQFTGGYNAGLRMAGLAYDIPIFCYGRGEWWKHARGWIKEHRLDCVIAENVQEMEVFTGKLGIPIPEKIGFAGFNIFPGDQLHAGINQNARKIGAAAVDLLIGMLHRNEKGLPETPVHTLVDGEWQDGTTVRDVNGVKHRPL